MDEVDAAAGGGSSSSRQRREMECLKPLLLMACLALVAAAYITYFHVVDYMQQGVTRRPPPLLDHNLAEKGYHHIPNVVHYVRFDQSDLSFADAVCILSAYINLKPSRIVIHTNTVPSSGKYWQVVKKRMGKVLQFNQIHKPVHIFGKPVSVVQHASDFVRIQTLVEHGGIYLDNDVFVVKSFDKYRNLSVCSIGWPVDADATFFIGNQIFVCPPGDAFMQMYLDSYRTKFDDGRWYYNAGQVPAEDILHMNVSTDLINAVPDSSFGIDCALIGRIFKEGPEHEPSKLHWDWRTYTAIHLLYRHRNVSWHGSRWANEEYRENGIHDEEKVKRLDSAFGEMARLAYYGSEEMVSS